MTKPKYSVHSFKNGFRVEDLFFISKNEFIKKIPKGEYAIFRGFKR